MPNSCPAFRVIYCLFVFASLALPPAARAERFGFIAIGDMPYNLPGDYAAFDRVIARINTLQPAFTIHVGDIINGQTRCDDALFLRVRDMSRLSTARSFTRRATTNGLTATRPKNSPAARR